MDRVKKGGGETEGPSASADSLARPVSTQSTPVIGIPRGRTWARGACGAERDSRSPVRASGRAGRALRTSLKERGLVHPCADAGRGGGRTRTLCQLTVRSIICAQLSARHDARGQICLPHSVYDRVIRFACMPPHAWMPGCKHSKLTLGAHFSGDPQRQGTCTRGM